MVNKAVFWDFDGTLVYPNESFAESLTGALGRYGGDAQREAVGAFLKGVLSWYGPERDYVCRAGEKWWADLFEEVKRFCRTAGIAEKDHDAVCALFRKNVISYDYRIYPDAKPMLEYCARHGWRNYLLSNNYPELPMVVKRLGIDGYFADMFVSSNIGYEKPRIELFRHALEVAGHPGICWMVGDNPVADVMGARTAGLNAVLVHRLSPDIAPENTLSALEELKKLLE